MELCKALSVMDVDQLHTRPGVIDTVESFCDTSIAVENQLEKAAEPPKYEISTLPLNKHLPEAEAYRQVEEHLIKELLAHPALNKAASVVGAVSKLYQLGYYGPYLLLHKGKRGSKVYPGGVTVWVPSQFMPEGQYLLVQNTPDVVRLVQHSKNGGMVVSLTPQIRTDYKGNLGACLIA